jgi:hypothetical protein
VDHHLQGELEEHRSQERKREAFADDRRDVLVREVQDDDVDEDVDDIGGAGAGPAHPHNPSADKADHADPQRDAGAPRPAGGKSERAIAHRS